MGTLNLLTKLIVFLISAYESLFGVVTRITFDKFNSLKIVRYVSPVPGGISINKKSKLLHLVEFESCLTALLNIGPLHATASSDSVIKPMDIISIFLLINGFMYLSSFFVMN